MSPKTVDAGDRTSLEKGLTLLQQLATAELGMSIAELAEATGLNRTTTHRLCEALEEAGWLQFAADGASSRRRRVSLGPRTLGLAVLVNNKYDPETRLEPLMENLSRTVGETVHAGMLDDTWIIHVARSVPDAGLHMAAPLGSRELAHVTALGKAMLATLTREELLTRYRHEELLVRTERAIATRTALLEELERVRLVGTRWTTKSREEACAVWAPRSSAPQGTRRFAFSVTSMPVHLEGERLEVVAAGGAGRRAGSPPRRSAEPCPHTWGSGA